MQQRPERVEASAAISHEQKLGPLKLQSALPKLRDHIAFQIFTPVAVPNETPEAERYLILRLRAKNTGHTAKQLRFARALEIRLFLVGGQEVKQTYARDASKRVPLWTPLIEPTKNFDFDRIGAWTFQGGSIASIFLYDESGGVTNFEGLRAGRYFFTADYAFQMPDGTGLPIHLVGEPFDIH